MRTGKSVGFGREARHRHFGLKQFLTGSDGHDITSPDFFMQNVKIIRTKSRKLSSKQKSSNNRERARKDLARAYRKLYNQRKDFHFKTAVMLCEKYSLICMETLNIKGMAQRWGRKIHSLSFSEFIKILEYEAKWACPQCGTYHDRDRNAAINILMVGASTIGGELVRHSFAASTKCKVC